jgi:hypothetical protein
MHLHIQTNSSSDSNIEAVRLKSKNRIEYLAHTSIGRSEPDAVWVQNRRMEISEDALMANPLLWSAASRGPGSGGERDSESAGPRRGGLHADDGPTVLPPPVDESRLLLPAGIRIRASVIRTRYPARLRRQPVGQPVSLFILHFPRRERKEKKMEEKEGRSHPATTRPAPQFCWHRC